jgi:PGF-pre-PGF domain-containing protein
MKTKCIILLALLIALTHTASGVTGSLSLNKTTIYSGEPVTLTGSVSDCRNETTCQYAIVSIGNTIYNQQINLSGSYDSYSFSFEWPTSGYSPGSVPIAAWIVNDTITDDVSIIPLSSRDNGTTVDRSAPKIEGISPDLTTAALILNPTLSVGVSVSKIAKGDRIKVNGTAKGQSRAYIWAFDSKGTTSDGLNEYLEATPDADGTFESTLSSGMTSKDGNYTVFFQILGRDGWYSNTGAATVTYANFASLGNMMGDRILSLLESKAEEPAGDDVYQKLNYQVISTYVTLNAVNDIQVGDELSISGTTNRVDGTNVVLTLERGGLPTDQTTVTTSGGNFSATFSTTGLLAGAYKVTADDLVGHASTEDFKIVLKRGNLNVTKVALSNKNPYVNASITAVASVMNTGDGGATGTINFAVGTDIKCSEDVTLAARASKEITCIFNTSTAGSYILIVNDTVSESFTVRAIPTPTATPERGRGAATIEEGTRTSIFFTGPVESVSFVANSELSNVRISIQKLSAPPEDIPNVTAALYTYFVVDTENIEDFDVESITIEFKVDSNWMTVNSIDPESIELYRYSGANWDSLTTTSKGEAEGYMYYYAKSSGFSTYAIASDSAITSPTYAAATAAAAHKTAKQPGFEFLFAVCALSAAYLIFGKNLNIYKGKKIK